jgi:vesicle-associated membrane protein-associated protein A
MAMEGEGPSLVSKGPLLLDPPQQLIFRGPFNERKVCRLVLKNISQKRIGFKMRCTAAEYYAANPASGIVEPNGQYIISGIVMNSFITTSTVTVVVLSECVCSFVM